jgi:hypothetical protein
LNDELFLPNRLQAKNRAAIRNSSPTNTAKAMGIRIEIKIKRMAAYKTLVILNKTRGREKGLMGEGK